MKDQKKTKAQLIQELVAERQKTAATDVSAVERLLAVERVRAQAVDMRGTHDLRQVVAVVFKEMRRLEIDTPAASIIFLDEEAETGTHYGACVDPKTLGFARDDDPAEDRFVVLDDILADGGQPRPLQEEQRERLVGSWRSGEIGTSSATTDIGVFVDHYSSLLDMTAEAVREWLTDMHGDWAITNVPFRFGLIGYREREHHAEHDEIVADLAGGLELGYRRFLDFQKVESQNRALVVEQALERVRTQVAGMQQSAHLYRVVTGVKEELKRLGVNFENVSIDLVDLAERTMRTHLIRCWRSEVAASPTHRLGRLRQTLAGRPAVE